MGTLPAFTSQHHHLHWVEIYKASIFICWTPYHTSHRSSTFFLLNKVQLRVLRLGLCMKHCLNFGAYQNFVWFCFQVASLLIKLGIFSQFEVSDNNWQNGAAAEEKKMNEECKLFSPFFAWRHLALVNTKNISLFAKELGGSNQQQKVSVVRSLGYHQFCGLIALKHPLFAATSLVAIYFQFHGFFLRIYGGSGNSWIGYKSYAPASLMSQV